jgi:hypothetical protein
MISLTHTHIRVLVQKSTSADSMGVGQGMKPAAGKTICIVFKKTLLWSADCGNIGHWHVVVLGPNSNVPDSER